MSDEREITMGEVVDLEHYRQKARRRKARRDKLESEERRDRQSNETSPPAQEDDDPGDCGPEKTPKE